MPNLPRLRRPREAVVTAEPAAASKLETPRIEVIEAAGIRWFNVEGPGPVEQAWLEQEFSFHPLDIEDVFSRNQRPKIDESKPFFFAVLAAPLAHWQRSALGRSPRTCSTWAPQPAHEGLPHCLQFTFLHIPPRVYDGHPVVKSRDTSVSPATGRRS